MIQKWLKVLLETILPNGKAIKIISIDNFSTIPIKLNVGRVCTCAHSPLRPHWSGIDAKFSDRKMVIIIMATNFILIYFVKTKSAEIGRYVDTFLSSQWPK